MIVEAPYVAQAKLRNAIPLAMRPYGVWFIPLYAALYRKFANDYETFFVSQEWTYVYFGGLASLQLLLWLAPFWNINVRELFETQAASSATTAQLVKIVPTQGNGKAEFVKIERAVDGSTGFIFQQRRFLWDAELQTFRPPRFWIDAAEQPQIGALLASQGVDAGKQEQMQREYGPNIFDIPVPTFMELWKEHAVAPFFVFQIFSCCLWFLDEMWKSSLFMLFMLVSFESTVVWQRQRTMAEFRGMGLKPYPVHVFRSGKWIEVETPELLPGDLVSVTRTQEDSGLACDMVLLSGTCVVNEAMLTGESTPLLKENIGDRDAADPLDIDGVDRIALLAGGTKTIQVSAGESKATGKTPDGGALALVARTGFETTQGQLVRTMIFSAERVGSGSKEAYFFILFLLMFAIAASRYVWVRGSELGRQQNKLLLHCVMIITSVVPPELPMELTLAVNTSLSALSKFYIYCTEPFRIPFAGRIDVCCFDKTGTLTEEDLLVEGVDVCDGRPLHSLAELAEQGGDPAYAIASAHALVQLDDGEIVGDPMEQTTLKSLGWKVGAKDEVASSSGKAKLQILKRFAFSSALKRSASIARVHNHGLIVAVKGAPEVIATMLSSVPASYTETFTRYTRNGSRVLAFAYKTVASGTKVNDYSREQAESQLKFAGFIVYQSPLKPDAVESVQMLNQSSHRTMMITGDNPLTAIKVARDVGIVEREVLILDVDSSDTLVWTSESKTVPYVDAGVELYEDHDLCMTGAALARVEHSAPLVQLIRHTWVYARVSPAQKEFILRTLKDEGYLTLMCGDGTNDVGALKQAHIGIALLNGTQEGMKKMADQQRTDALQKVYEKQKDLMMRWSGKVPPVPAPIAHLYPPGPVNPHYIKTIEARGGTIDDKTRAEIEKMNRVPQVQSQVQAAGIADKMTAMMDEDDEDAPQLKLGDASCAAPLTSKLRNVDAVVKIIRQGRCTLVTTIQMYKILALNCLISAYTMSVLYLAGIKISDSQSVATGILLSACSMSVSRGKVVEQLSKERPQPGIFNLYIMGSILGQFAVHVITLILVRSWVYALEPPTAIDLDGKFAPSLLNTAMYLLQAVQEISTYAVNYQGRPFRESLKENKGMYYGVIGSFALAFALATEFFPELNEQLQLVKMTDGFKVRITAVMLTDLVACYGIEHGLKHFFSDYRPRDIALRLEERGTKKVN